MTKLELQMTNNELEARVIELETKLAVAEREADVINLRLIEALEFQGMYETLKRDIEQEAGERLVCL